MIQCSWDLLVLCFGAWATDPVQDLEITIDTRKLYGLGKCVMFDIVFHVRLLSTNKPWTLSNQNKYHLGSRYLNSTQVSCAWMIWNVKFKFDNYTTELPFQPRNRQERNTESPCVWRFPSQAFFFASCVGKYEVFHFIVLVNLVGWIEMPGFLLHSRFLDDVVGLTRMIGKGNGND